MALYGVNVTSPLRERQALVSLLTSTPADYYTSTAANYQESFQ